MLKIVLAIGGIQVIAILIGIARSKIVALLLGPAGVGIVSVIDQVVQVIAYVAALGLPAASIRFLSRAHSEDEERFREVFGAFLKAILILGSLGALAGCAIAAFRPDWLGRELSDYRAIVAIAMFSVPGMLLGGFIPNVLAAAQRVRASALMAVVSNSGLAIGSVAGILAGGLMGMYFGVVAALLVITALGLMYVRISLSMPLFDHSANVLREVRSSPDIIYFSALQALGAVAMAMALLIARHSVLSTEGEAAAGLLQSAYALSLALGMVLNPTNGLYLTPVMNRKMDEAQKFATALTYQTRLAALLILFSAPLVLFPETCLYILFSIHFIPAADSVYIFVLAQVVLQIAGIYQAVLIGLDRINAYAIVTFGGHATAGLSAWFLVPAVGVSGAAMALLAGAAFTCLTSLAWLHARHGIVSSPRSFVVIAYAVTAIPAAGYAARFLPEWEPWAFALRIGAGLLLVGGTALVVAAEDRRALGSLVAGWVRSLRG